MLIISESLTNPHFVFCNDTLIELLVSSSGSCFAVIKLIILHYAFSASSQLPPSRLRCVFSFSRAAYVYLTNHATELDEVRRGIYSATTPWYSVAVNFFCLSRTLLIDSCLFFFFRREYLLTLFDSWSGENMPVCLRNTMPSQMQLPVLLFGLSAWKWNTCGREGGHSAHAPAWIGLQSTASLNHSYCTAANGMKMGSWQVDGNYSGTALRLQRLRHCSLWWRLRSCRLG